MAEFFDFFMSGSVAHITTLGTISDVSIAVGTGTIANIEIAGHEWEITNTTGTFVVANLNCIPLVSSGGYQFSGHSNLVYSPFRVGQTLKDTIEFKSIYFMGLTNTFYDASRCEASFDHLYMQRELDPPLTGYDIVRINAWDISNQVYTPSGGNVLTGQWCVYDNNTLYLMEMNSTGWELVKVVFNPNGTQTKTVISSFGTFAFNGCSYDPFSTWYCASIKYGSYDVIVCVEIDSKSGGGCPTDILRFTFYNVTTHNIVSFPIDLSTAGLDIDANPDLGAVSPSIYNNKLILTWPVVNFHVVPVPGTFYCPIPTFIADISNSTVVRIDDFMIDIDDPIYVPFQETSIINYTTGDYYFQCYNDADGSFNIIGMELSSPSLVEVATNIDEIELFQGYPTGYGVERAPVTPDIKNLRSIPDMTILGAVTISSSFELPGYIEGNCFIDWSNHLIWSLCEIGGLAYLQGTALSGGVSRNIRIVDWTTIPWAYSLNRKISLIPVAGQLVVGLFSRDLPATGGSYTWLWFLLKENIPCRWPYSP